MRNDNPENVILQDPKKLRDCVELKNEANFFFKEKNYDRAIKLYVCALDILNEELPIPDIKLQITVMSNMA